MTLQELTRLVKAASEKMRADDNTKGAAKYLEHFSWLLFLKVFDQVEDERALEAEVDGQLYARIIESPYRWSDWSKGQHSGDDLTNFIADDLLPHLRDLGENPGALKIAQVFEGVSVVMKSGYVLAEVLRIVDRIEFHSTQDFHAMSVIYETLLSQMGGDSSWSGEHYTPRPLIEFIVDVVDPQIGERTLDPCSGSCGFLVAAYQHLSSQALTVAETEFLHSEALHGRESGEFPYVLGMMNLLLHGVVEPDVVRQNSLERDIRSIQDNERYDIILTNPPFGGSEHPQVQQNFPIKSSSTQLLFMQLILASLKDSGRLGVVLPESFLSNDGVFQSFREKMLREWRVHTIVSIPAKGIWYKDVKTDLVFIDGIGPTEEILFVEVQPPPGVKNFSRVRKPLTSEALEPYLDLVQARRESEMSWLVKVDELPEGADLRPRRPEVESELTLADAVLRLDRVRQRVPIVSDAVQLLEGTLGMLDEGTDDGYPSVLLRDVLRLSRDKITIMDEEVYRRLRVTLHGKGIVLRDEVPGREVKTKTQYLVRGGQFVVAEIDAKVGGMGLLPHDLDGAIVSSHYFAFDIVEEKCLPGWLDLLGRSGHITRMFAAKGATNYASVRPEDVLELEVPLPSINEQARLLRLLDAASGAGAAAAQVSEEMGTVLQEFRLASLAGRLRPVT